MRHMHASPCAYHLLKADPFQANFVVLIRVMINRGNDQ